MHFIKCNSHSISHGAPRTSDGGHGGGPMGLRVGYAGTAPIT